MVFSRHNHHIVPDASGELLIQTLETLPDALLLVDRAGTIVYANVGAQELLSTAEELPIGKSFWRSAPRLSSLALLQAMSKVWENGEPADIAYHSPVQGSFLQVHIVPTAKGLLLHIHMTDRPATRRAEFPADETIWLTLLHAWPAEAGVLTPEGNILEVNQRFLDKAQVTRAEIIGKALTQASLWSASPCNRVQLASAMARCSAGEEVHCELHIGEEQQQPRDLEVTFLPHFAADQRVAYLLFMGQDITERKRSERDMYMFVDMLPQLVWTAQPDGYIDYYNQRWLSYTGLTFEQSCGEGWMQCIHPDDLPSILPTWQQALQTGSSYETALRLRHGATGEYRWFLSRCTPFKDSNGCIRKYIGTCTDIDEWKQAEQQLQISENKWHVLTEALPQLIWTTTPDGQTDYFNHRWYDYTCSSFEDSQGEGWSRYLHPDDRERTLQVWKQAVATRKPYEIEYRFKNGNTGNYHWFLARALPVFDETGNLIKWFGTSTDIDERKRMEDALQRSQRYIRALVDSNIIGIVFSNDEHTITEANNAFFAMTGYTQEDLRAGLLTRERLIPPEERVAIEQAMQETYTNGQHAPMEIALICKDNSRLPVLLGSVVFEHDPLRIVGFILDNAAPKALEQRKNDFISMASHELKAPLTALKLQTSLLEKQMARQGIAVPVPALGRMETQLNKLNRLIEDLLDVSKIQAGSIEYLQEPVDLHALLLDIIDTFRQTCSTHTIVFHSTGHVFVIGDQDRLGQVFVNLLGNAIKYSPEADSVEVDLSVARETATVRVQDHGCGIPREQREKIFERFYRGQSKGISGLGMGLYIVADIVKRHGGTIIVDSNSGQGSIFALTFPCLSRTELWD
jgi:PAS domain S-box-containing protein